MKRTLLHLDCDPLDARALRWAREAGFRVVATTPCPQRLDQHLADQIQTSSKADSEASLSLAEAQAGGHAENRLAGVFSSQKSQCGTMAQIAERFNLRFPDRRAVQGAMDSKSLQAKLHLLGIGSVPPAADQEGARRFKLNAFFREDDFVRGGIQELKAFAAGTASFGLLGHLENDFEDELYDLLENTARALQLSMGPISASIEVNARGSVLTDLCPCFDDPLMSSYIAPLALGKSPVQAWFAALAQAGGPFDSMPYRPRTCAGWMALRSEEAGRFLALKNEDRARKCRGIDGVRSMHRPGDELEANTIVAVVWGTGEDEQHLQQQLSAALKHLGVKLEERSAA